MNAHIRFAIILVSIMLTVSAGAAIIQIDLSPLSGIALSTNNYASGDHTTGLSALNAVAQPASSATGGEIGSGIFFDDVTKELTYNIGYGSDFGYTDLSGSFTIAHIHGPVAVQYPSANTGAGVVVGLTHTAGSSALTGSFSSSTILDSTQEANLFNNLLYVNVHSSFSTGGEIRGQLVPVIPEPTSVSLIVVGGAMTLFVRRRLRG